MARSQDDSSTDLTRPCRPLKDFELNSVKRGRSLEYFEPSNDMTSLTR